MWSCRFGMFAGHISLVEGTEPLEEHSDHRKNRERKLLGHLVGVREAGGLFELKVEETCVAGGAERGLQYPCTFKSGSKAPHRIPSWHHGDDCLLVGTCSDVKEMTSQISSFFIKATGILGLCHDDFKSISMIHRVVRWVAETTKQRECIEYATDPWHREVLLVESGLSSARGATTLFVKS